MIWDIIYDICCFVYFYYEGWFFVRDIVVGFNLCKYFIYYI